MPAAEREAAMAGIMAEILADRDSAFHSVAVLYQDFLVRCRIRRLPGEPLDLAGFRRRLTVARAGAAVADDRGADWDKAVTFSAELPEDMQGVFLLIARAAMESLPCPPDEEIARTFGSRSPGRARRVVAYMEERGFVVTRVDYRGNRVVALPDLGWETGPGDPKAAASEPAPERAGMDAQVDLFAAE
jgi:hypothetical protein